jgi:hypothetical protein
LDSSDNKSYDWYTIDRWMHRFTAPADPTDLPDFVNKAEWDAAQKEGKSIAKVFKN